MKKYLGYFFGLLILPAVICASLYTLDQKGFFQIDLILVQANSTTSQKDFIEPKILALEKKLSAFKGVSLWKFPLSQAAQLLKNEAWIKDFQLSRSWPSQLVIEILPETISYVVSSVEPGQTTSAFYPVTDAGEVLAKVSSAQVPNVIVVSDASFIKNQKIRKGAIDLIHSLPKQGALHPHQVSEIGFDKKEGYWLRLIQSDAKINLGEEQFEIKTARVAQVIDYLEKRDLKARVIDANLSKKVLVRMH